MDVIEKSILKKLQKERKKRNLWTREVRPNDQQGTGRRFLPWGLRVGFFIWRREILATPGIPDLEINCIWSLHLLAQLEPPSHFPLLLSLAQFREEGSADRSLSVNSRVASVDSPLFNQPSPQSTHWHPPHPRKEEPRIWIMSSTAMSEERRPVFFYPERKKERADPCNLDRLHLWASFEWPKLLSGSLPLSWKTERQEKESTPNDYVAFFCPLWTASDSAMG